MTVSEDRKRVLLAVENLKRGRVYELHLDRVKSGEGDPLLHPDAFYTLNELQP